MVAKILEMVSNILAMVALRFFNAIYSLQFCGMKDFIFSDDLEIKDGDFVIGESDNQHQKHVLIAYKGEYKANPELGVGIEQMLNDDDITPILIEAKKNLQYDGVDVNDIFFTDEGKLTVDGKYKN